MIYDQNFVNEVVKAKLLEIMARYQSVGVSGRLGDVFFTLVATNHPMDETSHSPDLDLIARCYPNGRVIIAQFGWLLADKGEFGETKQRLADSSRWLKNEELQSLVLGALEGQSYATKLNTWAATCEEWLQVCNIDWVKTPKDWHGTPPPELEEEIMRWIPKTVGDENYFW
jgi:hypothetical protein